MFAPKAILVPTDFSRFSDQALAKAVDIAKQFHSRIYLFHVLDQGLQQCIADYCLSGETMRQIEEEGMRASKERLESEAKRILGDNGVEITFDIGKGIPYDEILKEQKAKGIDLIVIASHGRTGILKNLIGGVAEKVARGAECPVLLVRGQ
ncbi:MAG: universal stress protein [Syntrophales bacterium]